jgi:hypothetical protein
MHKNSVLQILNGIDFLYREGRLPTYIVKYLRHIIDDNQEEVCIQAADAFSLGQLKSKLWIVKELEKLNVNLGTVFICAGWYATLAQLLFNSKDLTLSKVRSFDIDSTCAEIAETFNKQELIDEWTFKASTLDIHNIEYDNFVYTTDKPDGTKETLCDTATTIINTSCEHIKNFNDWYDKIPEGKLVVLQNNNYDVLDEHINCVYSLEEFSDKTPMSLILYEGELVFNAYTRYMKIGYK